MDIQAKTERPSNTSLSKPVEKEESFLNHNIIDDEMYDYQDLESKRQSNEVMQIFMSVIYKLLITDKKSYPVVTTTVNYGVLADLFSLYKTRSRLDQNLYHKMAYQ